MMFSARPVSKQCFHGSVPKQLCSLLLHLVLSSISLSTTAKYVLFSGIAVLCYSKGSFPLPCSAYSVRLESGDLKGPFQPQPLCDLAIFPLRYYKTHPCFEKMLFIPINIWKTVEFWQLCMLATPPTIHLKTPAASGLGSTPRMRAI